VLSSAARTPFLFFASLFLVRNGLKKTLSVGTYYGPTATRVPQNSFAKEKKKTEKINFGYTVGRTRSTA
jgi:hypothetical protein